MADTLKNLLAGAADEETEPLLRKDLANYLPNELSQMDKDFKAIYDKMCSLIWFSSELVLNQDQIDMRSRLNKQEIHAIKFVVSFFANADAIVAENIGFNLGNAVQPFYCKNAYIFIEMMEGIHAITYDKLMRALFPTEIDALKRDIINIPSIRAKMNFMAKYMGDDRTFNEKVLGFLAVESIMFSASFAIIFWFKSRALLPGVCAANELINRDEGLHQDFGVLIHSYVVKKESSERIREIIKEAVNIECVFIDAAIPEETKDLSANRIKQYVKYVADRLCMQLKVDKIYNVENSCAYMSALGLETRANFFETQATAYLTPSPDKTLTKLESGW